MINKYREKIEWDAVINRSKEWKCNNILGFGMVLLDHIYKRIIPGDVIAGIKANAGRADNAELEDVLLPAIIEMGTDAFVLGDTR